MAEIELEAFYPYPIEHVWKALTESESIAQWLMKNEFKPQVGYKFKMWAKPMAGWDGIARCVVLEVEEPHRLSWSQCGNDGGKDPFLITWKLKEEGKGTKLSLVQDGFKGLKGLLVKKIMARGWKRMFDQRIPLVLEYASKNGWDKFPKDRRLVESDCHS